MHYMSNSLVRAGIQEECKRERDTPRHSDGTQLHILLSPVEVQHWEQWLGQQALRPAVAGSPRPAPRCLASRLSPPPAHRQGFGTKKAPFNKTNYQTAECLLKRNESDRGNILGS